MNGHSAAGDGPADAGGEDTAPSFERRRADELRREVAAEETRHKERIERLNQEFGRWKAERLQEVRDLEALARRFAREGERSREEADGTTPSNARA